jgi:hypothetical protein
MSRETRGEKRRVSEQAPRCLISLWLSDDPMTYVNRRREFGSAVEHEMVGLARDNGFNILKTNA